MVGQTLSQTSGGRTRFIQAQFWQTKLGFTWRGYRDGR